MPFLLKVTTMRRLLATLAFLFLAAPAFAQQFTPSKAQHAKLVKAQKAMLAAMAEINIVQAKAAFAQEQLIEACKQIALANHWPESVVESQEPVR